MLEVQHSISYLEYLVLRPLRSSEELTLCNQSIRQLVQDDAPNVS
jgi:hypothetical protein